MRELHLLKNAVSPRRERNFGAPQGRDNAEMELGWDRVGLRLGPMLAYVGLSWPMSGLVWTYYVGSESFRSLFPIWFWPPGVAITTITIAPRGRSCQGGGVSVLGLRDLWADMVLVSSRARFEFEELVD